jgi:hypothetical protein
LIRSRSRTCAATIWVSARRATSNHRSGGQPMGDIVFILITVAFFALAAAYTRGCERL